MSNKEIAALCKTIAESFLALSKIFSPEEKSSTSAEKSAVLSDVVATEVPETTESEKNTKSYTKEEVRALLAQKAKADVGIYKADVKAIVSKYSTDGTLTKIPEEKYPELVAALEVIGNA